jgi:hypothetical protein
MSNQISVLDVTLVDTVKDIQGHDISFFSAIVEVCRPDKLTSIINIGLAVTPDEQKVFWGVKSSSSPLSETIENMCLLLVCAHIVQTHSFTLEGYTYDRLR